MSNAGIEPWLALASFYLTVRQSIFLRPESLGIAMLIREFIARNNEKTDKMIHSIRTHKAIINCLFDMLPEASLAESDLPNDAGYRSQPERDAMWILQNILPFHPREAREAGIIRQWLVHYPFGGPTASLPLKRQVMSDIINSVQVYEDGDFGYAMQNILDRVLKIDEFREELIKYELIDTSQPVDAPLDYIPEGAVRTHRGWQTRNRDPRYYNPSEGDDWLADVPVGVVRTDEDRYRDTGGRRREESMEEQALRRRRRMAMVLGENGRPIQSGDIIQRDPVVLDEEVEEELEQLIEEVSAQEGTADTGWWGLLRRLVPGGVAPLPSMGDT